MNEYQKKFLVQSVLGRDVKIDDPNDVIRKCIKLADQDMLSGGRFVCKQYFNVKKQTDRVGYMVNVLTKTGYNYKKIDKKVICRDLFWECDKEESVSVNGKYRPYKPYGLAQKLVNMTFKYLYIFGEYIKIDIDFSKCDCPLDSVILNGLTDKKWTNITSEEYQDIQDKIKKELKGCQLRDELGNLAYDEKW